MQESTGAADERCAALLEQAVGQLGAEQYARMQQIAQDRMALCPDVMSAFVLGLSQGNLVDSLAVSDPAQREQLRRSALRHLRIAAAGGSALPPRFQLTAHEWIVHLQELGGPVDGGGDDLLPSGLQAELGEDYGQDAGLPLEIPPAPPPQPKSQFPWGPLVVATVGVAALTTGIVLGVSAESNSEQAHAAARQLRELQASGAADREQLSLWARQTQDLHEQAKSQGAWANCLFVAGAAGVVVAAVWYWALPPKGKWRWAAGPSGLHLGVRF